MLKRIVAILISAVCLMSTTACSQLVEDNPSETTTAEVTEATTAATEATTTPTTVTTEATTVTTEEPEPDIRTVTLMCAGDNLIHSSIYNQAKRRAKENGDDDGYDFDYLYEKIEGYFEGVDIAILNQETIITDEFEPSSYPCFCSPEDLGEKMMELGFNVFSICNNHVLDKGESGLLATLNYWKEQDVVVYGAYENEEDMNNIRTMDVDGITFAFLGYMQHTNGISLSSSSECCVIRITDANMELIEEQVRYADTIADVVVVSVHYGTEVSNELSELQKSFTPKLVEWGADLIIGTQAHTAQTMEYIDKPDGGQAFVFYGLGNFASAMADPLAMVGIIGKLEITKNMDTGEITIENVRAIPIITQYGYNYSNNHIEPYVTYTDELLEAHGCSGFTQETIDKVLSYIPEEFLSIE